MSPLKSSLMWSSRVANQDWSAPFRYTTISPGPRCPIYSSPIVIKGFDESSYLGSEVGSLVGFSLGGPVSEVVSVEGGFLGASCGPYGCMGWGFLSSSLKSSGLIRIGITLSLSSESLSYVSVTTEWWVWWLQSSLCYGVAAYGQA